MIARMRLPFFTHRFVLQGLNLERFLNLMQQKEIPLLAIQRLDSRTLLCECCSADLRMIAAIVQEKGWRMQSAEAAGLSAAALRLKKRPGILIGIVLMAVCMAVLPRFIWRVDIVQAGPYHADIASYLSESGYRAGTLRTGVDAKALESALLERYPQIAWFHVYVVNSTLVVEVTQGVAQPDAAAQKAGSLYAAEDGILHSIRVNAGTPLVKPGAVVRRGDELIRGEERSSDGTVVPVRADGVVLARCWKSFTVTLPMVEIQSTETGRETSFTQLCTPWFSLPSATETPEYLASNLYLKRSAVGGAFFPLTFQTFTYREVSMERIPRDASEVRREAGEAALKKLKTELFGDEIIDKWVDYCMIEDDTLAATVTAERLVDIGVFLSP